LRKAIEEHPEHLALQYFLADAEAAVEKLDPAKAAYVRIVQSDAGRTSLTGLALRGLANIFTRERRAMSATYCLAWCLWLDKDDPSVLSPLAGLLRNAKLEALADRVQALQKSLPPSPGALPPLPAPPPNSPALPATRLYSATVPSVVLVRRGEASGSGVCVGNGIILTNRHVVAGNGPVIVTTFALVNNKPKRLRDTTADIVREAKDCDLAVLRVQGVVVPALPVAADETKPGEKVYALGNPGLGTGILEQSFSEGVVSAAERSIKGQKFLQHTAAINRGNSGGPLLDQRGCVVGINTLVTDLQGVNFAIPAQVVREVFAKP